MTPHSHPLAARLHGLYAILDPAAVPAIRVAPDRVGATLGVAGRGEGEAHPPGGGGGATDARDRLLHIAHEALAGGARLFQYRDKTRDKGEQFAIAAALQALCRQHGALFFINDHADIALAIEADGVHLGRRDLPVAAVRKIVPATMLIGASTNNLDEARRAVADAADYVSVGRLFPTESKTDTRPATLEMLHAIKSAVPVPVCAIGGINESNIGAVIDTGADMADVISAIGAADDVREATRRLVDRYDTA